MGHTQTGNGAAATMVRIMPKRCPHENTKEAALHCPATCILAPKQQTYPTLLLCCTLSASLDSKHQRTPRQAVRHVPIQSIDQLNMEWGRTGSSSNLRLSLSLRNLSVACGPVSPSSFSFFLLNPAVAAPAVA